MNANTLQKSASRTGAAWPGCRIDLSLDHARAVTAEGRRAR